MGVVRWPGMQMLEVWRRPNRAPTGDGCQLSLSRITGRETDPLGNRAGPEPWDQRQPSSSSAKRESLPPAEEKTEDRSRHRWSRKVTWGDWPSSGRHSGDRRRGRLHCRRPHWYPRVASSRKLTTAEEDENGSPYPPPGRDRARDRPLAGGRWPAACGKRGFGSSVYSPQLSGGAYRCLRTTTQGCCRRRQLRNEGCYVPKLLLFGTKS